MRVTAVQTTPPTAAVDWRPVALIHAVTILIGVGVFIKMPQRSVSFNYELAAVHWCQSEPLYAESAHTGHGFIYLPQAGILHFPYALLTEWTGWKLAGDVAWRIVSWLCLAVACWRFVKLLPSPLDRQQWRVALVTSLLGLSCLRIGQSTILMTALLLLGCESWSRGRFTRAAVWLGLAVAIKPLAIVMVLLLTATSAPMRWRLALSMIIVLAAPFALQRPEYVIEQYQGCRAMLQTAARLGNEANWAQLFGLLDFLGIVTPSTMQTALRAAAALTVLGLVWRGMQRLPAPWPAVWLMTWTVIYLMLFNPRTENSTYCMFGPVLGLWTAEAFVRTRYSALTWTLCVLSVTTATSYELGKFLTPAGKTPIWLAPLSCTIVTLYLLKRFFEMTRAAANAAPVDAG